MSVNVCTGADVEIEHTVEPLYSTKSCRVVEKGTMVTNIPTLQKSSESSRHKLNTAIRNYTQWISMVTV